MNRKEALLVAILICFCTVTVARGQVNPEISKYGSLMGLKDENGKDLLNQIKPPLNEGYVIAYRLKGHDEDRFVYVIGDQVSKTLKVDDEKSNNFTRVATDGVLRIARHFTWDEKAKILNSSVEVENIGADAITVRGFEYEIDTRLLETRIKDLKSLDPDLLGAFIKTGVVAAQWGNDCKECPIPPCGKRCITSQLKASVRYRVGTVFSGDLIGKLLPPINGPMLGLYWPNSGRADLTLGSSERFQVVQQINFRNLQDPAILGSSVNQ